MNVKNIGLITVILATAVALLLVMSLPAASASPLTDQTPGIVLVDEDGTGLGNRPLLDPIVHMDTETTPGGVVYRLAANTDVTYIDTYVKTVNNIEPYKISVTVTAPSTSDFDFYYVTGILITITDGSTVCEAVLTSGNNFTANVTDSYGWHIFQPNERYQVKAYTYLAYDSTVKPLGAKNLTFTFTATMDDLHDVKFYSEGEVIETRTLQPTAPLGPLPEPSRGGYQLLGWKDSNGNYVSATTKVNELPSDDITAEWQKIAPDTHTIVFRSDGGTVATKELADEDPLGKFPSVSKSGYSLVGWFDSNNKQVYESTLVGSLPSYTVTAKWQEAMHEITFVSDGEVVGQRYKYPYQPVGTLPTVTKEGYELVGWFDSKDHEVHSSTLVSELPSDTITAKWREAAHTIKFVSDGKTVETKTLYPEQRLGVLPTVTKEGYEFTGWYSGDKHVYSTTLVSQLPSDTINAHWRLAKHTITFISDGKVVDIRQIYPENPIGAFPDVALEGHELIGWFDSDTHQVSPTTLVSELKSDTITAHWRLAKHTISFVSDGKTVATKDLYPEEALGTFPEVSKDKYELVGWFDSKDAEVSPTTLVSDLPSDTVTAKWRLAKHTITFISDDTVVETREIYPEDPLGQLPDVTKEKYELVGWFSDSLQVSADTLVSELPSDTITAKWKEGKHTIQFVSDGNVVTTKDLYPDETLGAFPDVTKEKYELVGWFDSNDKSVGPDTKVSELPSDVVTAKWKEGKHTISFVSDGKTVITKDLYPDEKLGTFPPVTKEGHELVGWFDSNDVQVSSDTLVSELPSDTVTAKWKEGKHTITFISEGKTVDTRQLYPDEMLGDLPKVTRPGYEFLGWFSDDLQVSAETLVSELPSDIIGARWNEEKYKITYVSEGKTVDEKELALSDILGTFPSVTREGFELEGWFSGTKQVYEDTLVKDLPSYTITAKWKEAKHTIIFVSEGETVEKRDLYPSQALGKLPTVTRTGYEFLGWFDSDGTQVSSTTLVSELPSDTITAQWKEGKHTIKFISDGKTVTTKKLYPDEKLGTLPSVTKTGYELVGWFSGEMQVSADTLVSELPSDDIVAQWKAAKRTITYMSDSKVVETKQLYPDEKIGAFPAVTKDKYELVGWFTGSTQVYEDTLVQDLTSNTITAKWQEAKQKIVFMSDGKVVETRELTASQRLGALPDVTLEGYELVGWFDSKDKQVNANTKVSDLPSNIITAKWKEGKHTITFISEDKTVEIRHLYPDQRLGTLPSVTRTGYELVGWFSNDMKVSANTLVSDLPSDTVTAQWKEGKHTIKFVSDGKTVEIRQLYKDDPLGALPSTTKEGYELVGWFSGSMQVSAFTLVSELPSETITAQWKEGKRTITYVSDGDVVSKRDLYPHEQLGIFPKVSKENYDLVGWFSGSMQVYEDTLVKDLPSYTITAQWKEGKHTITFMSEGKPVEVRELYPDQMLGDLPKVTRPGYEFLGWFSDDMQVSATTVVSDLPSEIINASWDEEKHKITYVSDGVTVATKELAPSSIIGSFPSVSKTGFELIGWFDSETHQVSETTLVSELQSYTIVAHWREAKQTITYVSDGETVLTKQLYPEDLLGAFPSVSKTGFELIGWFSNDTQVYETTKVSDLPSKTITAHWKDLKRTITFISEGETIETRQLYPEDPLGKLPEVTWEGHEFLGWFSEDMQVSSTTSVSELPSDTINAHWREAKKTITFISDYRVIEKRQLYPDETLGTLPTVTKEDHEFVGWYSGNELVYPGTLVSDLPSTLITAKWKETKQTITFISDDKVVEERKLYPDQPLGTLPTVTKKGFEFLGWFSGSMQVSDATIVSDLPSHTIEAHWHEAKRTITFMSEGKVIEERELYPEESLGKLPSVTREGYELIGWFSDETQVSETTVVSSLPSNTIKARWHAVEPVERTITYVSDGVTVATKTLLDTERLGAFPTVTKESYELIGWFDTETHQVSENTLVSDLGSYTITAHWQDAKRTITFTSDGTVVETRELYPDQRLGTLPAITKEGYKLTGWFSGDMQVSANTVVSALPSDTIDAHWERADTRKHTIMYMSNDHVIFTKQLADYEPIGEFPEVHRAGYELVGWFDSNTHEVHEDTLVEDLLSHTITAHWKRSGSEEVTITFVSDGKVVETRTLMDSDKLGPLPTVSKKGYELVGWFDAVTHQVNSRTVVSTLLSDTITAHWKEAGDEKHTIRFVSDGKTVATKSLTDDQRLGTFPQVEKEGYELVGWFDSRHNQVYPNTSVSSLPSYTVTAEWKPLDPTKRTISFVSDGETVSTKELSVDDPIGAFPTITKEGYKLKGWFDANGVQVHEDTLVSALPTDIVTASWEKDDRLTVYFESMGEIYEVRHYHTVGDVLGLLPAPMWEGHDLIGWKNSEGEYITAFTTVGELPTNTVTAFWEEHVSKEWPRVETETEVIKNPDGSTTTKETVITTTEDGHVDRHITTTTEKDDGTTETTDSEWKSSPGVPETGSDSKKTHKENDDGTSEDVEDRKTMNQDGTSEEYHSFIENDDKDRTTTIDIDSKTTETDGDWHKVHTHITIEYHPDGSETRTTDIEEEWSDGVKETRHVVTMYAFDGTKVLETTWLTRTEPGFDPVLNIIDYRAWQDVDEVSVMMDKITEHGMDVVKSIVDSYKADAQFIGLMTKTGTQTIPEDLIQSIVDYNYGLIAHRGEEVFALDRTALIAIQSIDGDVTLIMDKAESEELTEAQIKAIGDDYAVSLRLLKGDTTITELDGKAYAMVQPGYKSSSAFRVIDTGEKQAVHSMYSEDYPGTVFEVDHLSVYVMEHPPEKCWFWLWVLIILIILITAITYWKYRQSRD